MDIKKELEDLRNKIDVIISKQISKGCDIKTIDEFESIDNYLFIILKKLEDYELNR